MGIIEEARDRVLMAEAAGQTPVAVVLSRDNLVEMRSEAEALRYIRVPLSEAEVETFMSLPIEVTDGHGHVSVRVRPKPLFEASFRTVAEQAAIAKQKPLRSRHAETFIELVERRLWGSPEAAVETTWPPAKPAYNPRDIRTWPTGP